MLNFIPVNLPEYALPALSATSEETGLRYLIWDEDPKGNSKLLIEGLETAPANDRDRLALTFNEEGEAVDYADRFDLNQGIADREALPVILRASGDDWVSEILHPDRTAAEAAAGQLLKAEYAAYLPSRKTLWWTRRGLRLLRAYGRVETPGLVLTYVDVALSEDADK